MASTLNPQELAELKQLYKDLQNIQIPDMNKFIQALGGVEEARKNLTQMRKEFANINSDVNYFAESLAKVLQEIKGQNNALGKTKSAYSSLSSIANKLKYDQDGISRLSEKELKKMKEKFGQQKDTLNLAKKLNEERIKDINRQIYSSTTLDPKKLSALRNERKALQDANSETQQFLTDTQNGYVSLEAAINKRIQKEKEIQKAIGLTGNVLKGLSKIPGIGSALDTEQALDNMRDFADELKDKGENVTSFSNRLKIAGKGFSTAFGGLKKSLTDPIAILTFIVERANQFNKVSVDIGKNLGTGTKQSDKIAQNLASASNYSTNLNFTFKNAAEAMGELNSATGGVAEYSANTLETQIMLTKQFGLTGEEAAGIYKFSVLTGKSSEKVNDEMVGAFASTRNMVKGSADFKTTIAAVSKISGQLAANFKNNPAELTKAVVQAQALGTTLEQAKSQGEALLDFSTSLENELKAELLTGQQINLERARAAALMGDQVTVAKELANQGMTYEKFQNMNVLAQESFAKALGLSTDQLAEQLNKQKIAQEQGKSLAQITKEEALEAEKRQTIQNKFNIAIEKLQDLVGNLVGGPFAILLDMLSEALKLIGYIVQPFQFIYDFTKQIGDTIGGWLSALGVVGKVLKVIAGIAIVLAAYSAAASVAAIPVIGWALAPAVAAAMLGLGFGLLNSKKGDDVMSEGGYGKRTLLAPEGAIKLNDKDTVIAGTDLGGGSGGNESIAPQIDLTPMIAAINQVKASIDRLYSKDTSINMDSKKVGTTLSQKSYKVA
jgi:hypothetical protein